MLTQTMHLTSSKEYLPFRSEDSMKVCVPKLFMVTDRLFLKMRADKLSSGLLEAMDAVGDPIDF